MTEPAPSDRKAHLDALAVVLVLGCCLVWGVNQVAAKLVLAEIAPLQQAAARSALAALALASWSIWRGLPLWRRDGTGVAGWLVGMLFAIEFGCIFSGLQFTTASRMAVFLYLAPFVVALGMPLISRSERLSGLQTFGLVAAFGGVVWAFAEGFTQSVGGPRQWLGDALGMAGAALWGTTTLVLRATRLSTALPEKTLLYQLAWSGLALALAAWAAGEPLPRSVSMQSLLLLGFQALVVTFISYLVWFWLLRHYPATLISSFTLLTPILGLLAGAGLLGEAVTPRLLVALVAVSLGIALVNRRPSS